ncbi:helix-turn-helix domain-containing protein [Streptosporangium sp. NPDC002721]|uniref:helix-turn-helix domain-containing protein n=1 Tax=Streptosporangium sp. NPDC002721 TaxID=3366188 RepID=UPI0036CA47FE
MAHNTWERTGAERRADAYQEARDALLLGQQVYNRRTELGLSQAELAERAGMTQPQVSRLETGGVTPTLALLRRLARALDADLNVTFTPHAAA